MGKVQTHTEVIFLIKDEPVLDSIQREFKTQTYTIGCAKNGNYTKVQLNVDSLLKVYEGDMIILDGWKTQFEYIRHY